MERNEENDTKEIIDNLKHLYNDVDMINSIDRKCEKIRDRLKSTDLIQEQKILNKLKEQYHSLINDIEQAKIFEQLLKCPCCESFLRLERSKLIKQINLYPA